MRPRPGHSGETSSPRFTLVVTCKGRLTHLRQSLPLFMQQSDTQVVVVDYSCPDGTGDFVEANFPAAQLVRVPDRPYFNASAARNAGAKLARSPHLIFCDADTILAANFTALIEPLLTSDNFLTFRSASGNSLGGSCVVSTRHFQQVRGFDEVFSGYGGEDLDFYWRLSRMGVQRLLCEPTDVIRAIEHGQQLRSAHYEVKDIRKSFLQARAYRLVKETLLGLVFAPELPLAPRRKIWADVAAALNEDRFEIRVRLPGNSTSGFLNDWQWTRELLVSFARIKKAGGNPQ
ncbi:MAG: glycosyltransferase family 2 protein [Aestuariivirga sp.]